MRPAISIDFGAAYTKIALRKEPSSTATLLNHEKLRLDDEHVCIPTIAAWREEDDRWIFGGDAIDIKPGNGIHVFRNWKPILFTPPSDVLDPESPIGRLFYYNLDGGDESWPPIKKLGVKYFEWLLEVMLPGLMGYAECQDPVLRISIPDFSGESEYTFLMEEIIMEAGWKSPYVFSVPEPESNLTGALSQGKNAMTSDPTTGALVPDLGQIFSGSGLIDYIKLSEGDEEPSGYVMLMVDIGAYTADFAVATIDGGSGGVMPPFSVHSEPYGIEMLDGLVKQGLSDEKKAIINELSATDREAYRRAVYAEGRSWSINNITIGDGEDREKIDKCMKAMATRVANEIGEFLDMQNHNRVDEVVFTGGGTNIQRMTIPIAESLVNRGVKAFHSASLPPASNVRSVKLSQQVVRGASALGGASVLFGDE